MFKVGDKVRRISNPWYKEPFMYVGGIYTVIDSGVGGIVVKGHCCRWDDECFELVESAPKPHVHAEVIKAWADGHKIQFHTGNKNDNWEDTTNPMWYKNHHYRIKPEPKPDRIITDAIEICGGDYNSIRRADGKPDNVKFIFDGETGELKDVKLINK